MNDTIPTTLPVVTPPVAPDAWRSDITAAVGLADALGREVQTLRGPLVVELLAAARACPSDEDLVEHNPDEGESLHCCGGRSHTNMGRFEHRADCWVLRLRAAAAAFGGVR